MKLKFHTKICKNINGFKMELNYSKNINWKCLFSDSGSMQ